MDERSDRDLVEAAASGDAAAFEALYDRYRGWVLALARRHVGDDALAHDVLQETFAYLLRAFPGARLTARMKTWLYPVVTRSARDLRAKRARRAATALPDDLPARAAEATSSRADLARVLGDLAPEARDALLLRYVDDLTLAEIAEAMHVPLGTVKSRIHLALRALREDPEVKKFFIE